MARPAAISPMKAATARQMRRTAALLDGDHPETVAGDHLRDAARVLESGQTDGAKRHLDAAMELLTPRNLYRHGITDDDGHALAKHHMHQVHRHRLAVQDIEDTAARNDRLRAAARGQPGPEPEPVAASNSRPAVLLAAWQHEARGPGGEWVRGAYDRLLAHPQLAELDAHDRAVVTSHLARARSAAAGGDHDTAEQHLKDARRRATSTGKTGLRQGITRLHDYHHAMAAAKIGVTPMRSKRAFNAFIARQPRTADVRARVVPAPKRVPFALATELSARTGMLERTPAPRGRPGGPGLYDVKGMGHTPYLQQIVKALIEKRGMPPGKAYAIARGAIRRWLSGRGKVHPEVRAAAARAEAGEEARQARAKSSHGHAVTSWEQADRLIELAVVDLFNPYHAPPGSAQGGQFSAKQGSGQPEKRQDRRQRAVLLRKAAGLRAQIRTLEAQLPSASPPRRTASRTGKSKTSAPAKKGSGATSAAQAKAGKAAAGRAAGTAARTAAASRSTAAVQARIVALRGQLQAVLAQLRHL